MSQGSLILPTQSTKEIKSKDKAVGLSPWRRAFFDEQNIMPKTGNWNIWYQMYKRHAIVRSAVDKIAETATNVGYDFVPRDSRAKIRKNELVKLQDFFYNQTDFIYELRRIYKDLLIYGDAFMYIVPNKSRQPHKLKRLPPQTIAIKAATNGDVQGFVQFDPNDMTNSEYISFMPHEVMHFRIDDPDNDLYGLSPLASLEAAVATDLYAQQYNAAFFRNSGITGTIILTKGLDEGETARNRQFLLDNYSGPEAAHLPLFLEGDNVEVKKSVVSHTEMGFLEGRKFIILEILAVLDVPPAKIGIMESANRSNSKEQDKSFIKESIMPLQNIVENVVNGQFIRPILGVNNTKFVHSEGDTRDAIELMMYYTRGIGWGIYNANEVREKLGMAPVEGGSINGIMTPTGFVPLDRMNLLFQLPKPNTDTVPADPRDPVQGEATPKTTSRVATGESRDVAKSKLDSARRGVMTLLGGKELTKPTLVKAYSYFREAEGVDAQLDEIGFLVQKAKDAYDYDPDLVESYFERMKDEFYEWIDQQGVEYESL